MPIICLIYNNYPDAQFVIVLIVISRKRTNSELPFALGAPPIDDTSSPRGQSQESDHLSVIPTEPNEPDDNMHVSFSMPG